MVFGSEEPSDSGGSVNHQDSAASAQQPMRCLADCGFFGSQQFQGYCSQCYVLCEIAKLSNNTEAAASQHTTVSIDNSIENGTGQNFTMSAAINQSSITLQQNDDSTTINDDMQNNPVSDPISVNAELGSLNDFDNQALSHNNEEKMSINKVQISKALSANSLNLHQDQPKFKSPSRSIVPESALIIDERQQQQQSSVPPEDLMENKAKKEKPIQKDPSKCAKCNSRLRLTDPECSCGLRFCYKHRFSESHNCTFDYKSKQKDKLTKEIPKVSPKNIKDF